MKSIKSSKEKKRDRSRYVILLIVILGIVNSLYFACIKRDENIFRVDNNNNTLGSEEEKVSLEDIKARYSDYVKLLDNSSFYVKDNDKYVKMGTIRGEIEVSLDPAYEIIDEYLKVLNSDYYIKYDDNFEVISSLASFDGEYKYYKNYIPYNENIILKENSKLFVDDVNYYEVSGGSYVIIIKDTNRYGIEFNNRLVYVSSDDVIEVVNSNNSSAEVTDGISVLNYHFVVNAEEMKSCAQSICLLEDKFDSQIKYLKDNDYYGVSMRDLELFIDGKIRLPKRSVSITIDDGWYVARSIIVLERYQILGTLFLIGSLASPRDYASNYLEIHSHTWNMHGLKTGDDCPNSSLRGGITCFDEERILEDLRQSRESLNNTTYFCYPFYDYNERAISLLKKAGFTMAFAGQQSNNKVKIGQNKFKIPRYVIYSNTNMNTFINYVS